MDAKKQDLLETLACTCFAARRAARVITQQYERQMKTSGLRVSQFTVLSVLTIAGPLALSQLAEQLGMERTTLTRNIRPLLSKGWVTESATKDGRVRLLAVTKQGTATAHAALPRWREAQRAIARRLGGDAIRALAAASEAVANKSVGRR